jgi:hypothetical protein
MESRHRERHSLSPAPARPRQLLHRILDDPDLVAGVQALAPRALGLLIDRVGLEDAGELVSLATTEQLAAVFDDDLWQSRRPGQDEAFDPRRFALWLEVMIEAGEQFAASRVTELDDDLIALALHRLVLVIDMDELAVEMADRGEDDEAALIEKALESCPHEELGRHRVIARRHDGWDAIISLLLALDQQHHDHLERLLDRLAHVSRASIEDGGGLHEVLTAEETLEVDAAAEREGRRGREGFVAPSDAAGFLALARSTEVADPLAGATDDPVTRAYFRDLAPAVRPAVRPAPPPDAGLVDLLRDEGVLAPAREGGRPLLDASADAAPGRATLFRGALAALAARDPALHERRLLELNYLANVLIAGCALESRRFRPFEAAAAAVATCNLGLERLLHQAAPAGMDAAELAARAGAVALFRTGWRVLHDQVAAPARRARPSALDAPAAAALAALRGDCPCLRGPLATGAALAFIATEADLRAAQAFLHELSRADQSGT